MTEETGSAEAKMKHFRMSGAMSKDIVHKYIVIGRMT